MKKPLTLGLIVTAGSMANSLYAQDNQETMVVVGSRTPTQIDQVPSAAQVIEGKQLREQTSTGADLKAALGKLIPALDFGPQGRTNAGQNMRGRTVQVLIDGVSMNNSRSLSRQFDSIDPFNIERVEVLSGASSLYGGGATGGVINIITKTGDEGGPNWESEVGATTGFNNSDDLDYRVAQSASGGNEFVTGRIGVAYENNGRHYDANGDEIFPDLAQSDLQGNRSIDILGNLNFQLTEDQTLDLKAQLYESGYEGDKGVYFPNLTSSTPNLREAEIRDGFSADREPKTDRRMLNANYHHADFFGQDLYLQAYHREEESSFHPFPYPDDDGSYYFTTSKQNTTLSGLKTLMSSDISDTVSLDYGLDIDREEFDASQMYFDDSTTDATGGLVHKESRVEPRYPSFQIDGLSAFAQSEWEATQHWTLAAGIRQQHMNVDVADFQPSGQALAKGGESDYDVTLFNASALYDFHNGHQTWTSYSEGFDLPDPSKYYGRPGQDASDQTLDGIKTRQVELGWRYQGNQWQAQAAAYYSWSNSTIELDDQLNTVQRDDKRRDYGLEASATRYLGDHWQVGGTLHALKSEQKIDGKWKKRGITVSPYPSQHTATLHAQWSDLDRTLRLQANRSWDYEDYQGDEIEGNTTLDLIGSQQTDFGKVSLGIENLTDEQYSTPWGQRAAGFYSPYYGPEYLYDYQGRGRTYTLNWSLSY
jgi:iron complex outermembrane receptor protein